MTFSVFARVAVSRGGARRWDVFVRALKVDARGLGGGRWGVLVSVRVVRGRRKTRRTVSSLVRWKLSSVAKHSARQHLLTLTLYCYVGNLVLRAKHD